MTDVTIDMHCHLVVPCSAHGSWVHPRFARGLRARGTAAALGVATATELLRKKLPPPEEMHRRIHTRLCADLAESSVDYAAILAFDGVYDNQGRFDPDRTCKMVTNTAVMAACSQHHKMLFCASINPLRRDWEDELDRALENGAVMLKWLCSVMGFDPQDPRLTKFYRRLRDAQLPVLMHVGMEYALPVIDHAYANIHRLEHMLREGVSVVAAHCCGNRPFFEDYLQFQHMEHLAEIYHKTLWFDVSGMASPHRKQRLRNSIRSEAVASRLVFGTDFPVPVWKGSFRKELHAAGRTSFSSNYFDAYREITTAMRLPLEAYSRGQEVLAPRLKAMGRVL